MSSYKNKVCDYFMNGRCKFGDNCHNLHPRSSSGHSSQSRSFTSHPQYNIHTSNRYQKFNQHPTHSYPKQTQHAISAPNQHSSRPVSSNPFSLQNTNLVKSNSLHSTNQTNFSLKDANSSSIAIPVSHTAPIQTYQGDDSPYSQISDLTKEEMDAFQGQSFVIGKIPLKPPPRDLCN